MHTQACPCQLLPGRMHASPQARTKHLAVGSNRYGRLMYGNAYIVDTRLRHAQMLPTCTAALHT